MTRPGRRRSVGPAGPGVAVVAGLVVPSLAVACAWMAGQAALDRWWWSQWCFWVPAWPVAIVTASGALAASRTIRPGVARRVALALLCGAALLAGARSARYEFGWAPARASGPDSIDVTHWNPQWPGERALDFGRALAPELGDVAILTTPGSMLRATVADDWLPAGYRARNFGTFGVVSRLAIAEARVLATATPPGVGLVCIAWVEVRSERGDPLRILVVDLPSDPRVARGRVAAAARDLLAEVRLPALPDLVVGDLNSTPGSVVQRAVAPGCDHAPPWRCSGWLGTYERPWAQLRIDAMLSREGVEWVSYRTLDLGIGRHRAQRGAIRVPRHRPE